MGARNCKKLKVAAATEEKTIEQLKQARLGYGTKADQSGYYLKGDDYKFEDSKEYIEGLSSETKKHIAATHLFGAIWKDFFMDDENKCEFMDYDANDDQSNIAQFILDHMLIRGGCVRDVIWGCDFNDVGTL